MKQSSCHTSMDWINETFIARPISSVHWSRWSMPSPLQVLFPGCSISSGTFFCCFPVRYTTNTPSRLSKLTLNRWVRSEQQEISVLAHKCFPTIWIGLTVATKFLGQIHPRDSRGQCFWSLPLRPDRTNLGHEWCAERFSQCFGFIDYKIDVPMTVAVFPGSTKLVKICRRFNGRRDLTWNDNHFCSIHLFHFYYLFFLVI